MHEADSWERKTEFRCKQCGKMFVRYVYEKVVRCEECRKANRMAALAATGDVKAGNPLRDATPPP